MSRKPPAEIIFPTSEDIDIGNKTKLEVKRKNNPKKKHSRHHLSFKNRVQLLTLSLGLLGAASQLNNPDRIEQIIYKAADKVKGIIPAEKIIEYTRNNNAGVKELEQKFAQYLKQEIKTQINAIISQINKNRSLDQNSYEEAKIMINGFNYIEEQLDGTESDWEQFKTDIKASIDFIQQEIKAYEFVCSIPEADSKPSYDQDENYKIRTKLEQYAADNNVDLSKDGINIIACPDSGDYPIHFTNAINASAQDITQDPNEWGVGHLYDLSQFFENSDFPHLSEVMSPEHSYSAVDNKKILDQHRRQIERRLNSLKLKTENKNIKSEIENLIPWLKKAYGHDKDWVKINTGSSEFWARKDLADSFNKFKKKLLEELGIITVLTETNGNNPMRLKYHRDKGHIFGNSCDVKFFSIKKFILGNQIYLVLEHFNSKDFNYNQSKIKEIMVEYSDFSYLYNEYIGKYGDSGDHVHLQIVGVNFNNDFASIIKGKNNKA